MHRTVNMTLSIILCKELTYTKHQAVGRFQMLSIQYCSILVRVHLALLLLLTEWFLSLPIVKYDAYLIQDPSIIYYI